MPNHVTNRLEINADRETVQKVMNFLKEEFYKLKYCSTVVYMVPRA